jgi:hypothetical protein
MTSNSTPQPDADGRAAILDVPPGTRRWLRTLGLIQKSAAVRIDKKEEPDESAKHAQYR